MKKLIQTSVILMLFVFAVSGFCAEKNIDKLSVPFSNPAKPGLVKAGLINGGITVEGYNGKEVIIEAVPRKNINTDRRDERRREKRRNKNSNKKAEGMQKIEISTTGLSVEEEDNVVTISTDSWRRTMDLVIKVPVKTSLKLNCTNNGDIKVTNVEGEFEINNTNGAVSLINISGSVIAHALNKDIVINFIKVYSQKSMSFSSLNGDIEVTFPKTLKATLKLKSTQGDIYSDFDISKHEIIQEVVKEDNRNEGGKYRISFEEGLHVKINGGGPEMQFTTFNGDVYIRKGK